MDDRYLWDRSGPVDAEIARVEALLAPLRHSGRPPETPSRMPDRRRGILFAAAAVLAAAALAVGFGLAKSAGAWRVETVAGVPSVGDRLAAPRQRLAPGEWIRTDAASRARVRVGTIGRVEILPGSRVRVLSTARGNQRLQVAQGEIAATISAPPRIFSVETPAGTAVDLGCEYRLSVASDGTGRLSVDRGWVELSWAGREAIVPAGYVCRTRPGNGPGTPRRHGAPAALESALDRVDFDPSGSSALDEALAAARPADALSLWHLLPRTRGDEQVRVFERLAALVPPPPSVTRAGALALDRRMLARWRFEMGTPLPPVGSSFWRSLWSRLMP